MIRPWLLPAVVVLCALPPTAHAQTGGASLPSETGGGAEFGKPVRKAAKKRRSARPLVVREFSVTPGTLQPGAAPARFAYRVDGSARRVRIRFDLVPARGGAAAARIRIGWKPTGVRRVHRWPLRAGVLPAGFYVARLHAVDDAGRVLRRTARASGRSTLTVSAGAAPVSVGSGVFPVQGAWSWGLEGAAFGADRGGRSHQGQDLMAAEGTPLVSPRAGYVRWKAYQASGAGHYLVIRADDGRDLVFMHLRAGSVLVGKDDAVQAGQKIAEVGNTGRSDGAHLHFEIWPRGWWEKGSQPIDPRPDLEAWAARAN